MRLFLLPMMMLCAQFLTAQEDAPVSIQNMQLNATSIQLKDGYKPTLPIVGEAFPMGSNFMTAEISSNKNSYNLRYNAVKDAFEYLQNGVMMTMSKEERFSPIYFPNLKTTVVLATISENNRKVKTYLFEYLKNDNATIYKRSLKQFKPGVYASSSFDKDQPNEFVDLPITYFVKLEEGDYKQIANKKSQLMKDFPEYRDKIKLNVMSSSINEIYLLQFLGSLSK